MLVWGLFSSEKEALPSVIHLCFVLYVCDQLGRSRAGTGQLCNVDILRNNVAGNYLELTSSFPFWTSVVIL